MTTVSSPERTEEFLRLAGDPSVMAMEIGQAQRSGVVLSREHPRLIDEHPQKWIALHDGKVVAEADSIDMLLSQVDDESRSHVIVRFIDRDDQILIL